MIASQTAHILEHLRDGHTLTPLKALELFGSLRLSQRIIEAEQRIGYNEVILHEPVKVNGKRVMSYRLVRLDAEKAA